MHWIVMSSAGPAPGRLRFLFSLISLLIPATLDAQVVDTGSRWDLGVGFVHRVQSDALASPLRYSGTGSAIGLGYVRLGTAGRLPVDVTYSRTSLKSRFTTGANSVFAERTHRLTLRAGYQADLERSAELTLLTGALVAGDVLYRRHTYPTSTEHFADLFLTFEVAGGFEWRPRPRLRIEQSLSLPLVGVVWRSPYTGLKYAPEARVAFPDELQGLRNALRLTWEVGSRTSVWTTHELTLLRHPDPWELATVAQRLRMGVEIRKGSGSGLREAVR